MNNLGKATVRVSILDGLPGIDKDATKFNFDISAFNWDVLRRSGYFPPLLTEQIQDELESFGACFPEKRKEYIDNYMITSDGSLEIENPRHPTYILFRAISTLQGYPRDVVTEEDPDTDTSLYDSYQLIQPGEYLDASPSYIGPKWTYAEMSDLARPNDLLMLSKWYDWIEAESGTTDVAPSENHDNPNLVLVPKLYYINQSVTRDGLWWAVESEEFLRENMPFWVSFRISQTPSTNKHETMLIISLGLADKENSYDICLRHNQKPIIYDYYKGRAAYDEYKAKEQSGQSDTAGEVPVLTKEFDEDISKFLDSQEEVNVGIMSVAGRLVIFVNEVYMIYNRVDTTGGEDGGTLKEAKIAKGAIRIYGTNVTARINVSPMTFAPMGIMALPIPGTYKENNATRSITYYGVKNNGTASGSVCKLPTQPDVLQQKYGVDCREFHGSGGGAFPSGVGFHKQGEIFFDKFEDVIESEQLAGADFYVLIMKSESMTLAARNQAASIPYAGCPYFFHLKGAAKRPIQRRLPAGEVTSDVISVSETSTAPDSFHALTTATVELYNKGGMYDYLRYKQHGITLEWGWSDGVIPPNLRKTFTGVIVSASTSETPGREVITLQCEDYMTILKNTPIINSPFYDGMVGYYAIADLADRGGIKNFIKDWDNEEDYFLPSGYAFSKPAMRFPGQNKLFDCMISIVKRFEAFIYFDGEGSLHINKLPGGLFSDNTNGDFVAKFRRDPDSQVEEVILNEKNIEYSFASTVNKINILTVDRDTRNAILYNYSAIGDDDNLLFRKIYMMDQAALGDLETAKTWAHRAGQRLFFPIRKTSFSAPGTSHANILEIFGFVKVDNQEYRLTSVGKKYSADSNDFTCEYGMEWLGGS